jgi:hypothetical protein
VAEEKNDLLLRVEDLKMHFPIRGGVLRKRIGAGACGGRRFIDHPTR